MKKTFALILQAVFSRTKTGRYIQLQISWGAGTCQWFTNTLSVMPPKKGHVIWQTCDICKRDCSNFQNMRHFYVDLIYYFRWKRQLFEDYWCILCLYCLLIIVSHDPKCTTLKRASRISASIPSIIWAPTWYVRVRLIFIIYWAPKHFRDPYPSSLVLHVGWCMDCGVLMEKNCRVL